jgi:hypothetical protein
LSGAADRKRLPSPAASRIAVEITSLADDESFERALCKVVRHLFGRMLAEISCRSIDGRALSAIAPVNVPSGDDCNIAGAVAPTFQCMVRSCRSRAGDNTRAAGRGELAQFPTSMTAMLMFGVNFVTSFE